MIYADNAATTKLDIEAFEAMKPFLVDEYSNPSQPYSFARRSKKAIKEARKIIADCIGANPEEIIFTSGGTESDNWALNMTIRDNSSLMTSVIEHHAILNTCKMLESMGREVLYIPVDDQGIVNLEWLEKHILKNTKLISVMFSNNEIGTIQPITKLAKIAHNHGCLFHTDAVQAVGHVNINVHEMNIDLLSASGHKFNGPKGIGFLYVRNGVDLSPFINGGNQENGLRAGTENVASIVAMAVALKNNCNHMTQMNSKLSLLENRLVCGLKNADLDFIRNGADIRVPGNISLSCKDCEGEAIMHRLDLMGICVSTGSACDSVNTQISHVIRAIKVPTEYAKGTIRISLGKNNTIEDVDKIVAALIKIIRRK